MARSALELHHRRYGDPQGLPVLLLHGLFGSAANWGSVARQLADRRYDVVVPDLRNHGQSPHADAHNYPAMADDVLGLLDTLGLDRAIVIGHSMGGKAAMQLALSEPRRVMALVVVDIAPVAYAHDFQTVLDAFDAVDLDRITGRADAERQMVAHVDVAGLRAFLMQNLLKDGSRWRWRLNLPALANHRQVITGFPETTATDPYPGPTLFLHGELSDYVQPIHHEKIHRLFSQPTISPVSGAGHWVYADKPAAFYEALIEFLDDAA